MFTSNKTKELAVGIFWSSKKEHFKELLTIRLSDKYSVDLVMYAIKNKIYTP